MTATRACKRAEHPETETVGATGTITTPATCTVMGKTTYTSNNFTNTAFTAQSKTLTDVPALGHDWDTPTYAWNGDNTQVTATRACKRADHPETETVGVTKAVTTPATCTVMGKTTYTSNNFANTAFTVQSKTLTDVPVLGHDWDAPTYAWNGDNTQVIATRACKRADHPQTETVGVTKAVTTPATCTEMGKTTYTSNNFTNTAFTVQSKTLTDVQALGHDWNAPTYVWNAAHTEVTATRSCKRAIHPQTETVGATGEITTPATCTVMGKTTYTSAAFANAAFTVQTVTMTDVAALGHAWNTVASVAAGAEDGLRGGIVCSACGQVQEESRPVSAQKVLRIPAMMDTIEEEAFLGVAAEQAIIPDGATAIGSKAFANCDHLLIVVIPSSVTTFGDDVFQNSDVAVICPDGSPAALWCENHHIPHNP